MICTSFNDVNVTGNRRLVGTGQNVFYSVLSSSVESWTPTYMSSFIFENFLLFKISFIIGQFLLFFASEEEKKSYTIKNFSDGIERFILGQYDKIARSGNTIPLKLRKICNPHSLPAGMRSAEYQITVLLKLLIITRIIFTNVLAIIQSKSLPGFGLCHHWTVWTSSFQTPPSGVCDYISLYDSFLMNLRLLDMHMLGNIQAKTDPRVLLPTSAFIEWVVIISPQ